MKKKRKLRLWYLHANLEQSVEQLCDYHVEMMCRDSVQVLCNAFHTNSMLVPPLLMYQELNPHSQWCSRAKAGFHTVLELAKYLFRESIHRCGGERDIFAMPHYQVLEWVRQSVDALTFPTDNFGICIADRHPPIFLPGKCSLKDWKGQPLNYIRAYRRYYLRYLSPFLYHWTNRPIPEWFERGDDQWRLRVRRVRDKKRKRKQRGESVNTPKEIDDSSVG